MENKPIKCCEHLAGKTTYIEPDERPGLMREEDTLVYSCLKTMSPVGPDKRDAAPSLCGPDRECFEGETD